MTVARYDHDARAVLARSYQSLGPAALRTPPVSTGLSGATVWRVSAGGADWALRRWPESGPGPDATGFIHSVLRHAVGRGADFVPAPRAADDGRTHLHFAGTRWEFAPWMRGSAEAGPAGGGRLVIAVQALARFHAATADFPLAPGEAAVGPPPSVAERRRRLDQVATTDWGRVADRAAAATGGQGLAELIRGVDGLLPSAIAAAQSAIAGVAAESTRLQPVIRDARREHFLFVGDRVTGLVDFGAMRVDAPVVDLARLLGDWAGNDPVLWRKAADAYGLEPAGRRLIAPLDASGVALSACNWLEWIAAGRPGDRGRMEHLLARLRGLSPSPRPSAED